MTEVLLSTESEFDTPAAYLSPKALDGLNAFLSSHAASDELRVPARHFLPLSDAL